MAMVFGRERGSARGQGLATVRDRQPAAAERRNHSLKTAR
jgi:hypothetical protein